MDGNRLLAIVVVILIVAMCCCAAFLMVDYVLVDWYCDHDSGLGHEIAVRLFMNSYENVDCSEAAQLW